MDMMEAARLDGANAWQMFAFLTLPHLRRYLELGILLGSIYIVQNFDAVFTITAGASAPPTSRTPSIRPSTRLMNADWRPRPGGCRDRHNRDRHVRPACGLVPLH